MSFMADLERGKLGERLFKEVYEAVGGSLKDVSDVPEYQSEDIDFVDECGDTWEVKTDYMLPRTGNVALESWTSTVGDSWLWKSKADYLVIVNPQTKQVWAAYFDVLRSVVKRDNLRTVYKDDGYKQIQLKLMPIAEYDTCDNYCFVPLSLGVYEHAA